MPMDSRLDFMLTEEQIALRQMTREFAEKEVRDACKELEKNSEVPRELLRKAQDMGFTIMSVPQEYGGLGMGAFDFAIFREELARGDAGFCITVGNSYLGAYPVRVAGTDYHLKIVADCLLNHGMVAFALTEPQAGSDSAAIATTAVKDGDEYVLNGRKCFITNGLIADYFTVFATVDKSKGSKGVTAFLVDANSAGFSRGKEEDKMGIRCSNTCDLIFEDVRIPAKNILGEEGKGFKVAMQVLNKTRPTAGAGAIGVAQAALDYAIDYSKQRVTFGKPICQNQGIQFMLADMDMLLQASRQMVWAAARSTDANIANSRLASGAKCFASDCTMKITTDAVQILGGYGYSREYPVEKLMRDAKIFQIFEGTNQIQRKIIAGELIK